MTDNPNAITMHLTREYTRFSEVEGAGKTPDGFFIEYRISDGPPGNRGISDDFATEAEARAYATEKGFNLIDHLKGGAA